MTIPIFPLAAEHALRGALNRAARAGLAIVSGEKLVRDGARVVGVCALGAAEFDAQATQALDRLPQGARGAIADGFDGRPLDVSMDDRLGAWHAVGARLRKAYGPRRVRS